MDALHKIKDTKKKFEGFAKDCGNEHMETEYREEKLYLEGRYTAWRDAIDMLDELIRTLEVAHDS
jgi:hypothetical protein